MLGLVLTAATQLWMTAASFDLLPEDDAKPALPATVGGQTGVLPAAKAVPSENRVSNLRDVTFPDAAATTCHVDQGTGAMLA